MNSSNGTTTEARGYAPVNGLKMYYEIEGTGDPLVCIPPAFGYAGVNPYPALVQSHTVITVDLQGHGRTADIPERPLSIEQYAKDVVGLLKYLGISKADFFGESYGGNAAVMIAIRYPELVGRVVTYAATFGPPQIALNLRQRTLTTRLPLIPRASNFREKTTRKWLLIQTTGTKFLTSLEAFSGKDFRTKSWLQSKRRFSSFSEITILSALSTPLRPSSSSPTPTSP
jgi:pimeloyl-ACP methyl ester carboxylesterase